MALTRKHFEAIAKAIREMPDINSAERRRIAEHQADYLATTNRQFDRQRFVEAATRTS